MRRSPSRPIAQSLNVLMVAGELSGDVYGAQLAAALQSRADSVEVFGCGGDAMRKSGADTVVDAGDISLLGITEVARGLPRARRALRALVDEADRRRPRLAVLIDSPSFNLRLARKLRHRGIPIVYFISPQIWAWKRWRIRQIKARVNKMLCLFDFEEDIYTRAGVPVKYVGHPLLDMVRPHLPREEFFARASLDPNVATIALLPGSRDIEVSFNLPAMLEAAAQLNASRKVQFVVAVAPTVKPARAESMLTRYSADKTMGRVLSHLTYDALEHCDVAVVASGTATLEAALRERPMVVVYRVSAVTAWLARFIIRVPFYSMVNLLAGKAVVPELIQRDFTPGNLAGRVEFLLDHPEARQIMVQEFRSVKARLGRGGAIERAADAVIELLERSEAPAQIP